MDEQEPHEDWTAGDLAAHCEWLIDRGYAKEATGKAQKTAVVQVFAHVEGEGWESTSIKDLDGPAEDDLLDRFATKARRNFKGQSLATYQGRFRRALASYRDYMKDPANFRPVVRQRESLEARKPAKPQEGSNGSSGQSPRIKGTADTGVQLIEYPFPVRADVLARLSLPADLRPDEAARLSKFLESLAVKETQALPSSTPSA